MTICTRCQGEGFINIEQIPESECSEDTEVILLWIAANDNHDVQVCDCCGDGEDWYGEKGCHYVGGDYQGPQGPYAYNGGLCECH